MTVFDKSRIVDHRRQRSVFKIESDEELRTFVDEWIGHMTFKELATACRERFGRARAPGTSVLHRYWHRRHAGHQAERSSDDAGTAVRDDPRFPAHRG